MTRQEKELQAIETLQYLGVSYLTSPQMGKNKTLLKTPEMLQRLIGSDSGRFRLGVIAFFLIHPEQAAAVQEALGPLTTKQANLRIRQNFKILEEMTGVR